MGAEEASGEAHLKRSSIVQRTLVLNASYEPLCVVTWQRAIVLVLAAKAEPVELSDRQVCSVSERFDVPSVIRMRYMVQIPWQKTLVPLTRRMVLARDDHRCVYCDARAGTIDHVLPRSRGGSNAWDNVVAACVPCNTRKANRTPHEASMPLRITPTPPKRFQALLLTVGAIDADWVPYLPAP